jgi:hypothetical protein
MRTLETLTIYLAIGAPFGVSYFIHHRMQAGRVVQVAKAHLIAALWPLVLIGYFFKRRFVRSSADASVRSHDERENKLDGAWKAFVAALYQVEDAASLLSDRDREKLERDARNVRESAEKFLALSASVANAAPGEPPSERELELLRIAGRTGDDLMVGGACVKRRNAVRLEQHHARARMEVLDGLAALGDRSDAAQLAGEANAADLRRLSLAVLGLFGRALDLFSLVEDEAAAMSTAQLLNDECKRLRRLASMEKAAEVESETGVELCTTHTSRLSHAPSTGLTTLRQG